MLKRAILILALLCLPVGAEARDRTRGERENARTFGPAHAPIYGFTWDSATDNYTRLGKIANEAASASPGNAQLKLHSKIRRCVVDNNGSIVYWLHPTDSTKKVDGSAADLTGGDGQVMVYIPRFYVRYSYSGTLNSWEICETQRSGFEPHWAFWNGSRYVKYILVGAYEGGLWDNSAGAYVGSSAGGADTGNDILASVSGVTPWTDQTLSYYRTMAANRGTGWQQMDYAMASAIQLLYAVEYADFDSQTTIGNGNVSYTAWNFDESIAPAGLSNSDGNSTNASNTAFNSLAVDGSATNGVGGVAEYMTYRGIENFYGGTWQFLDGANVHNYDDNSGTAYSRLWGATNSATFADDTSTNYTNICDLAENDGYIDNIAQIARGFFPTSNTGASDTEFCDYYYTYFDDLAPAPFDDWRVVRLGGSSNNGALAGAFFVNTNNASSIDVAYIGGRLAFK